MDTQKQYEAAWAAWLKAVRELHEDPLNSAKKKAVQAKQARVESLVDVRMRELHGRNA